jgi:lipopolysaccharide transport system permease protein
MNHPLTMNHLERTRSAATPRLLCVSPLYARDYVRTLSSRLLRTAILLWCENTGYLRLARSRQFNHAWCGVSFGSNESLSKSPKYLCPCIDAAELLNVESISKTSSHDLIHVPEDKAGPMDGFLATRLDYLYRIWALRYFWFSLVKNDLDKRYKRSFFGIGWSLLRPLSMTFIFCVVFGKLFNIPMEEYAPFLLIGMTTWQFFTESLIQGSYSFTLGAAYIRQQHVPLAIFPLRTILGSGFHSLIALAMALLVALFFKGSLDPLALLTLIPAVVLLFVLCWSLAIVSGVMYTHFPDTSHLLEILLQILFYVTPILYRPDTIAERSRLALLVEWNPITSLLALIRVPVLEGTAPALHHVQVSLLFTAVVATIAVWLLRRLERTLIFWI